MGLFDLFCPPRVPPADPGEAAFSSSENSCVNCHSERPREESCPVQTDWPRGLSRPLPEIEQDPLRVRWWIDENFLRTRMGAESRRGDFPFRIPEHDLQIELNPAETNFSGALGWFLNGETRINVGVRGEGLSLFLDDNPLVDLRPVSLVDGIRIFFSENRLTSDSGLLNFFLNLNHEVGRQIPMAYDESTGTTYTLPEYLRLYFSNHVCMSPESNRIPREGGMEDVSSSMDGGVPLHERSSMVEDLRSAASELQCLGTGYLDASCEIIPPPPTPLPYLRELALAFVLGRPSASRIDLERLYRDLAVLRRIGEAHPAPSSDNAPLFESAQLRWNLRPERISFENFRMEFDDDPSRSPLTVAVEMNGQQQISLWTDSQIHLTRLLIPGIIHLGRASARLEGMGPSLNLHLSEIEGEIRPFDVGQFNPSERGVLHLDGGYVMDGLEAFENNRTIPPGITIQGDWNRSLDYSVNLTLTANLEIPGLGAFQVSGNLLAHGRLIQTESGLAPDPETTFLRLENFTALRREENGDLRSQPPFLHGASITLSNLSTMDFQEHPEGFRIQLNSGEIDPRELPAWLRGVHRATAEALLPRGESGWPALSLAELDETVDFALEGRRGIPNTQGNLRIQTQTIYSDLHRLTALFHLDRFRAPLFNGVSLLLSPLNAQAEILRERDGDLCQFEVPRFEVHVNGGGGRRSGALQGASRLFLASPLQATYDPSSSHLDVEHLDLRFLLNRIVVPALREASREDAQSRPQISSAEVRGRFEGRFSADLNRGNGAGRICLQGGGRDVVLRDGDGQSLPDPLFSGTRWCATSVSRYDARHNVLFGRFFLDTTIDWGLLRYFGIHLNMRQHWLMDHRDFPLGASGYEYIERLFFGRVLQERRRGSAEGPIREELR